MLLETKSMVKRATKKCNLFRDIAAKLLERPYCTLYYPGIKPVLQHVRFSVTGCKKRNKTSFLLYFFLFLIGNQIHSADITLRIKVVISNLKQFATQGGCFSLTFSPYKVPLLDLTKKVSEFFMLTYNFHKKFSVARSGN